MNKRSVTLLEMLIALVLVLAMGALIFPSLMDGMEERSFESAADTTNEQLMMARAHAQATGSPVEVTYSAHSSQVQVRPFTPWAMGNDASNDDSSSPAKDSEPKSLTSGAKRDDGGDRPNVIDESWACRDLNHGVRIVARPPLTADSTSSDATSKTTSGHEFETLDDLRNGGQDVRLAVFMPDGSALLGDPVWLNDDKGRCGKLTINPWSGLPIFQRLVNADTDSDATAADAKDEPKTSDDATSDGKDAKSTKSKSAKPPAKSGGAAAPSKKVKSEDDSGSGGREP